MSSIVHNLNHSVQWQQMQTLLNKNRLPHAFLYSGSRYAGILEFAKRFIKRINCQENNQEACGHCQSCHLLEQEIHPDVHYIQPENTNSSIKIDQIREMQHNVYIAPRCGIRRFVIIEGADKLNMGAANALLKVLEEPPMHIMFILIAEQTSTLPLTIKSRCQSYYFPEPLQFDLMTESLANLNMDLYASVSPDREKLLKQVELIESDIEAVISGKKSVCDFSTAWGTYVFEDFLWILYLITAQTIQHRLLNNKSRQTRALLSLEIPKLFNRLDQINSFLQKIQQNIHVNQMLALDGLIMGFI